MSYAMIIRTNYSQSELYSKMYYWEHHKEAFVAHMRGEYCQTVDGFFQEVSSSMRFPYYFGWNWNAFDECMVDLEWLSFSSLLLVMDEYDLLFSKEENSEMCQSIFNNHIKLIKDYWHKQKIPIMILENGVKLQNSFV